MFNTVNNLQGFSLRPDCEEMQMILNNIGLVPNVWKDFNIQPPIDID